MLLPMVLAQLERRRLSLASYPVARAFGLSLLFHALLFVTVEIGHRTGLWNTSFLFPKKEIQLDTQRLQRLLAEALKKRQQQEQEMPLVFVEVDPNQAVDEAPKDAKYYSAQNSRAANPDNRLDTIVPKIDGKQERVPQTLERARPQPQPLQPAPPPPKEVVEAKPEPEPPPPQPEPKPLPKPEPQPEAKPDSQPELKPEPAIRSGDLAMAKPSEGPAEESKPAEPVEPPKVAPRPRIRRLADARREKGAVAGERMKQAGGVKRFSLEPSLDVRATPFGAYDAAIIAAIQKRWYDLLESRDVAANFSGKVVLEFRLNSDGRVSDMKVNENNVTEFLGLLCQRAVQDPAPFAPWPADLRRLVGKEYREVRFTFYYN
jgi:outer membrane biosynthesis protein TonB